MSLDIKQLSVLSYSNGLTQWSYRTPDTRRELEATSYWSEAVPLLAIGDFIFVQHIARGSAIYCVGPRGGVHLMTEWPPRSEGE